MFCAIGQMILQVSCDGSKVTVSLGRLVDDNEKYIEQFVILEDFI